MIHEWFSNTLVKKKYLQDIGKLSADIEKRIFQKLEPIEESAAPVEIKPLIKVINRLVSNFQDRSENERDFSANASHELRTPLAGIRIQTEIAQQTEDPKIQKKALGNIIHAVDQAERLIEQLLALARHSVDNITLHKEKISLSHLCLCVASDLSDLAEEKRVKLKTAITRKLYIHADRESISVLLHNLIHNAIKYSPAEGTITISLNTHQNKLLLCIADLGPGIPVQKRQAVLQRFQKVKGSSETGSGLGLAIVKRVCNLHNADLTLDSHRDGKGLKVRVLFNPA